VTLTLESPSPQVSHASGSPRATRRGFNVTNHVEWLEPGTPIMSDDLEAAEAAEGLRERCSTQRPHMV
jgi:hypothetical protein